MSNYEDTFENNNETEQSYLKDQLESSINNAVDREDVKS